MTRSQEVEATTTEGESVMNGIHRRGTILTQDAARSQVAVDQ